jgi:hypothetical protein
MLYSLWIVDGPVQKLSTDEERIFLFNPHHAKNHRPCGEMEVKIMLRVCEEAIGIKPPRSLRVSEKKRRTPSANLCDLRVLCG